MKVINNSNIYTHGIRKFKKLYPEGWLKASKPPVFIPIQDQVKLSQPLLLKLATIEKELSKPFINDSGKTKIFRTLSNSNKQELSFIKDHIRMSQLLNLYSPEALFNVFKKMDMSPLQDNIHILPPEHPVDYSKIPYGLNSYSGPIKDGAKTFIAVHGIYDNLHGWKPYIKHMKHLYPDSNLLIFKHDYSGNPFLSSGSLRKGLLNLATKHKIKDLNILAHSLGGFVSYGALQEPYQNNHFAYKFLDPRENYLKETKRESNILKSIDLNFSTFASPLKGSWAIDLAYKTFSKIPKGQQFNTPPWLSSSGIMSHEGQYMKFIKNNQLLTNTNIQRIVSLDDEITGNQIFSPDVQNPDYPDNPYSLRKGLNIPDASVMVLSGISHSASPITWAYWQELKTLAPQARSFKEALDVLSVKQLKELKWDVKVIFDSIRHNSTHNDDLLSPELLAKLMKFRLKHPQDFKSQISNEFRLLKRKQIWHLLKVTNYIDQMGNLQNDSQRAQAIQLLRSNLNTTEQHLLVNIIREDKDLKPHQEYIAWKLSMELSQIPYNSVSA